MTCNKVCVLVEYGMLSGKGICNFRMGEIEVKDSKKLFLYITLLIIFTLLVSFTFSCKKASRETAAKKASEETAISYPRRIIDSLGRNVTVNKPVERIIALGNYRCEAVKVLGVADKIVGIDSNSKKNSPYYFPELIDRPDVGTWTVPNVEVIASLHPDIVITSANQERLSKLEEKLKPLGITVIGFDFYREDRIKDEIKKLGYLLEKEDEAQEYIKWREQYEKIINEYVRDLNEEEKPKVFMEWGSKAGTSYGKGSSGQAVCTFAGGRNVAAGLPEYPTVSMEWVVKENPDVIVKHVSIEEGKWGWNNPEEPKKIIAELENRPGWSIISAVKNNRIYLLSSEIAWGLDGIVGAAYWAKWFHPSLEINPKHIYKEYLELFLGIECPEDIIFAYPPVK